MYRSRRDTWKQGRLRPNTASLFARRFRSGATILVGLVELPYVVPTEELFPATFERTKAGMKLTIIDNQPRSPALGADLPPPSRLPLSSLVKANIWRDGPEPANSTIHLRSTAFGLPRFSGLPQTFFYIATCVTRTGALHDIAGETVYDFNTGICDFSEGARDVHDLSGGEQPWTVVNKPILRFGDNLVALQSTASVQTIALLEEGYSLLVSRSRTAIDDARLIELKSDVHLGLQSDPEFVEYLRRSQDIRSSLMQPLTKDEYDVYDGRLSEVITDLAAFKGSPTMSPAPGM